MTSHKTQKFVFISSVLVVLMILPSIIGVSQYLPEQFRDSKQLNLLRVEHYLELEAIENTGPFHVHFVFPPDYEYQVPIVLELLNGTTPDLIDYTIQKDELQPNRVVNFSLPALQKGQHKLIHFTVWVLVETFDFSDAPKDTPIPETPWINPEDTRQWLSRSEVVQKNRPRIKLTANRLQGNDDTIHSYANNVSSFILNHRHGLFLLQLWTKTFFSQDALTTLTIGGENIGRSHLACALFRTKNIPARVLLVHNDQGFWTQMHYMVEYYIPNYGWILLDPTYGKTQYPTNRQIVNRICSIEDEQHTKHDYIIKFMKGEERWLWIDTPNVEPYYVDCEQGSKSQMFTEAVIDTYEFAADYTFFRVENVFSQYEKYMNTDLSLTNQQHFDQAVIHQVNACNRLVETQDINEFIYYIEKSYDAYKAIEE